MWLLPIPVLALMRVGVCTVIDRYDRRHDPATDDDHRSPRSNLLAKLR